MSKAYYLDDTFHGHPSVNNAKHDFSTPHGELQGSPVSSQFEPLVVYPSRRQSPQNICFDDQFQGHGGGTCILMPKRSLIGPIEVLFEVNHKKLPPRK